MSEQKGFRTANRRYMVIFVPMMTLYCVALFAALSFIDMETAPAAIRAGAALLISLPLVAILWSVLRLVKETDEYTRTRQLQALAEAGVLLTGVIFVLGFLERFGVIPDMPLFLFGPGFFVLYGLSHFRRTIGRTV